MTVDHPRTAKSEMRQELIRLVTLPITLNLSRRRDIFNAMARRVAVLKYWDGSSMTSPVAAGPKRTIMNVIEKDVQLFANKAFLLPVEGNSMVGDSIFDGDLIIVDPEKQIEDGDIVVATHLNVAGSELEAPTVKRFYHDGKSIRLHPSNPQIDPIFVDCKDWDREWKVQGKVRAVIHQFY